MRPEAECEGEGAEQVPPALDLGRHLLGTSKNRGQAFAPLLPLGLLAPVPPRVSAVEHQ